VSRSRSLLAAAALIAICVASPSGALGAAAPLAAPLQVTTAFLPKAAFFGDPVVAQVSVAFPPAAVEAATVQVTPSFAPFAQTGPAQVTHGHQGSDELVTYSYPIQCYTNLCVALRGALRVRLPPVLVTAKSATGGELRATGRWRPTLVESRLTKKAIASLTPYFYWSTRLPGVSYAISPTLWAAILVVVGVLFGLGAAALVGVELVTLRERLKRAALERLTPLERALAFTRQAARRPDATDRRKALNLLAQALESDGRARLAGRSGAAAWSPVPPTPGTATELADAVEQELASARQQRPTGETPA